MPLRQVGKLWKKSDNIFKDHLAGELDLGVLGKFKIVLFFNISKQKEESPDATIHLVEGV